MIYIYIWYIWYIYIHIYIIIYISIYWYIKTHTHIYIFIEREKSIHFHIFNPTSTRPIRPTIGSASVFPHGDCPVPLLHEGSAVTGGTKRLSRKGGVTHGDPQRCHQTWLDLPMKSCDFMGFIMFYLWKHADFMDFTYEHLWFNGFEWDPLETDGLIGKSCHVWLPEGIYGMWGNGILSWIYRDTEYWANVRANMNEVPE